MFAISPRQKLSFYTTGRTLKPSFWNKKKTPDTLKQEQIQTSVEFDWYHKQRLPFYSFDKQTYRFFRGLIRTSMDFLSSEKYVSA